MARPQGNHATQDSVCKLVQNGGLAKTLNTVRTVRGANNPFVNPDVTSRRGGSGTAGTRTNSNTSSGAEADRK